jgi:flagellar hook-associated protein 3 FlgL
MPIRVTDNAINARFMAHFTAARQRLAVAQEQIGSGKRINRPSDDPIGAGAVVRTRTAQAAIEQFARNAGLAHDALIVADTALDNYDTTLDRIRSLMTAGASDTTGPKDRPLIAKEIEELRTHLLGLANRQHGNQYLFGGTRQEVPPYDANGVPAATPTTPQLLQIDPEGIPLATGVTAENIFADATGTIFAALDDATAALRGTGDEVADKATLLATLDRLSGFADQARIARTQLGTGLNRVAGVLEQLDQRSLALEETTQRTEGADIVEAAVQLNEAQRAFEAILQTKANTGRRTLLDLLG